jgi:hypothetical protein
MTNSNRWLLDSGASMHICNNKSWFIDLAPENSSVLVGDNRHIQVLGRGTVRLSMNVNGVTNNLILRHVALVPNFGINLVSTGRLESMGFKIITEKGNSSLYFENELVGIAKRMISHSYLYEFENCISNYSLVVNTNRLSSNVTDNMALINLSNNNEWNLWHRRLGHLNDGYMKMLKLDNIKLNYEKQFCEDCHLCKATKLSHTSKTQDQIDNERLIGIRKGVIHSDLMGPMNQVSQSGCKYVLTYICSHTEYSYVYLLKHKSEQCIIFKEFKLMFEKQSNFKIKELRSDNGLEYFSNEFQCFLKSEGIIHHTSVAYVPQSNGKAERLNRTLIEKARTML